MGYTSGIETTFKDLKMETLEKLQNLLTGAVKMTEQFQRKEIVPLVICKDGNSLSVQASSNHYCFPRDNYGPYTNVEVWCTTCPVTEFEYSDDEPSAYVNIKDVVKFIDNHGGFKE